MKDECTHKGQSGARDGWITARGELVGLGREGQRSLPGHAASHHPF